MNTAKAIKHKHAITSQINRIENLANQLGYQPFELASLYSQYYVDDGFLSESDATILITDLLTQIYLSKMANVYHLPDKATRDEINELAPKLGWNSNSLDEICRRYYQKSYRTINQAQATGLLEFIQLCISKLNQ